MRCPRRSRAPPCRRLLWPAINLQYKYAYLCECTCDIIDQLQCVCGTRVPESEDCCCVPTVAARRPASGPPDIPHAPPSRVPACALSPRAGTPNRELRPQRTRRQRALLAGKGSRRRRARRARRSTRSSSAKARKQSDSAEFALSAFCSVDHCSPFTRSSTMNLKHTRRAKHCTHQSSSRLLFVPRPL